MNPALSPLIQNIETQLDALATMEKGSQRDQRLKELVALVNESVLDLIVRPAGTYQPQDAVFMDNIRLALQTDGSPELKPLEEKVATLATLLKVWNCQPQLPLDVLRAIFCQTDPTKTQGLFLSGPFAAVGRDPIYNAEMINEGRYPIAPEELISLLTEYGHLVRHLDLSLLLKPDDGAKLTIADLGTMLMLCPHLESLTLFRVNCINQLPRLLLGTSAGHTLKHMTSACCSPLQDPSEFPKTLKAACKQAVEVEFANNFDSAFVSDLLTHRISARDSLVLIRHHQSNAKDLLRLLRSGLKWSTFKSASLEKQKVLLERAWTLSSPIPIDALARLEKTQIEFMLSHSFQISQLHHAGMDLNLFFRLSNEDQRLCLTDSCLSVLMHFLRDGGTLSTFLSHPLREEMVTDSKEIDQMVGMGVVTLPQYLQMEAERRALFLANWRGIQMCGVAPQKFLSLDISIFQELMRPGIPALLQDCLMYGTDFEELCVLSAPDRQRVLTSPYMNVLIARGNRLNTILRLSGEELKRITSDPSGFTCHFRRSIPSMLQPQFAQMNVNDPHSVATFFCSAVGLATGLLTGNVPLPPAAAAAAVTSSASLSKQSGGIPLARFVELEEPLRGFVLTHSKTIGEMIRAGLDFEAFLKLTLEECTKLVDARDAVLAKLNQGLALTDILQAIR